MTKKIIAIDPGVNGGLALVNDDKLFTYPLPREDHRLCEMLLSLYETSVVIYLEQVTGFVAGSPRTGSSMFTFGMNYGFIRGVIRAMGMPIVDVPPRVWQLQLTKDGVLDRVKKDFPTQHAWKKYLHTTAVLRWNCPSLTLKTADASLILAYAIEKERKAVACFRSKKARRGKAAKR